jgi:hypothetical protein
MTLKRSVLDSAALLNNAPTTLDPPFVSTVAPSRIKCLPKLAIFSRLCFARSTNSFPLESRWFRIARKSSSGPRLRL